MQHETTWREFINAALAGLCALVLAGPYAAGGAPKRPNVLIITTDQQRLDATSAAGNRWLKTPNMDSIAAQGVLFMNSYCPYPLCSPSRASLHTGRMPHEIRVDHNSMPIDPAIPVSGQIFRSAGYETAYAGKWHLPDPYPNEGIPGFEVLNATSRRGKLAHDVDEATMNAAIEFLQRRHDKPFLLVVSFINPHDICLLAGETSPLSDAVWEKYQPAAGAELPPLPASFTATEEAAAVRARRPRHEHWDENHWRRYAYAYYRMVEDVDQQVGQVLNALRRAGLEQDTLIVFTSDHGEGLGFHRWTGKMMFYEAEAAVPLIIAWKGVTPAGRIDRTHLVSAVDVLPTICDYAGLRPPANLRGQSLRPLIEHPDRPGRQFVVSEMAFGGARTGRSFMVRTSKYKYMVFPGSGADRVEMLFDLQADPDEIKNLAAQPALAGELQRHRQLLAEWNKTTEEHKYPVVPSAKAPRRKAKAKR
ncbi:MAG: sulfatase family protein [Thermoguttaceae bacterium]